MELSHLTLEELEQKLSDLDKSKAPHEALELSNEIGRRKAERSSFNDVSGSSVYVVPFATRFMFISLIVFLVTCHFEAPDIRTLQIVGALSILYTLAHIFVWTTRNYSLEIVISITILAVLDHLRIGIVQLVQCYSFFYSVHYMLVSLFKDKLRGVIKKAENKGGDRKYEEIN